MNALATFEDALKALSPEDQKKAAERVQYLVTEEGFGRPSKYTPDKAREAAVLARLGATDEQMAEFLGINIATLYRWKAKHKDFCEATKLHKEAADDRVEEGLFQQAIKGNTTAAIFWLKNRRPSDWRDKREVAVSDHRSEQDIIGKLEELLETERHTIDVTPGPAGFVGTSPDDAPEITPKED